VGRRVDPEPSKVLPKDHKVKGQANEICLPYEKHFADIEEEDSFKLLDNLQIHNKGSGYTCFASSYCFFISDRELKPGKSSIVKLFDEVNSVAKFEALGLPIKKITNCKDAPNNTAYEIDL
jgi:hypothetical protein